jgi:hypothetical protein
MQARVTFGLTYSFLYSLHEFVEAFKNQCNPVVTGLTDPGGCGCDVHLGGVAAAESNAERPVPGHDAGDL